MRYGIVFFRMTTKPFVYSKRVLTGVRFFDQRGIDWARAARQERFYVGGEAMCVLGILFGSFIEGCSVLHIPLDHGAVRLGIELDPTNALDAEAMYTDGYETLTRLWTHYAIKRLA